MSEKKIIKGFSRLTPQQKIEVVKDYFSESEKALKTLSSFRHPDSNIQELLSGISENTVSNFHLPYNVAPNFLINGRMYMVPMVIEESSVVAAASSAARFWAGNGGFSARVVNQLKNGQLHFLFSGNTSALKTAMQEIEKFLRKHASPHTAKMEERGGGIRSIELKDCRNIIENYYQLNVSFDTTQAMGANFINTCLEDFSEALGLYFASNKEFKEVKYEPLMAILSNYNDQCLVEASVSCPAEMLESESKGLPPDEFARRMIMAVTIAENDIYRATTHNKGIMNGVDAVILATGNDYRAVEAGAHAWAARSGRYRSLSSASMENGHFVFSLRMPMAIGTVGGLTRLHPLASLSLEMLGEPDSGELMMIAACAGLANNYAAVRSLVTTGIQSGHMKMHLSNILMQLKAGPVESSMIIKYFSKRKVSYREVSAYLDKIRQNK